MHIYNYMCICMCIYILYHDVSNNLIRSIAFCVPVHSHGPYSGAFGVDTGMGCSDLDARL